MTRLEALDLCDTFLPGDMRNALELAIAEGDRAAIADQTCDLHRVALGQRTAERDAWIDQATAQRVRAEVAEKALRESRDRLRTAINIALETAAGQPAAAQDKAVARALIAFLDELSAKVPVRLTSELAPTLLERVPHHALNVPESAIAGRTFQHYKGGIYTLIAFAIIEADRSAAVVYRGADGRLWIRPHDDFFGDVPAQDGTVPRFAAVVPGDGDDACEPGECIGDEHDPNCACPPAREVPGECQCPPNEAKGCMCACHAAPATAPAGEREVA